MLESHINKNSMVLAQKTVMKTKGIEGPDSKRHSYSQLVFE
jgi:hypothetical protein